MAIIVNRPEQDLQEKLNQIDFGTLDYDKMPIGSVLQTRYRVQGGSGAANESETSSTSYQPTTFQVDITPIFENSLMVITATPNIKMNGDNGYQTIALFNSIAGSTHTQVVPPGNTPANSPHGQGTFRFTGVSTFWSNASILQMHRPQTTRPINYKLYQRNSSGSFTVRLGENGADEYIMVQEIKQ
jgi:hypothetical protein